MCVCLVLRGGVYVCVCGVDSAFVSVVLKV